MTLNQKFSIVALLLLGLNAQAKSDAAFLSAVAEVESGHNRKAIGKAGERGMYQVNKAAWDDASARLKAEVERLTAAGDAMYESKIGYYGEQILEDMKHHSGELCRNWNAAKEGKPSV